MIIWAFIRLVSYLVHLIFCKLFMSVHNSKDFFSVGLHLMNRISIHTSILFHLLISWYIDVFVCLFNHSFIHSFLYIFISVLSFFIYLFIHWLISFLFLHAHVFAMYSILANRDIINIFLCQMFSFTDQCFSGWSLRSTNLKLMDKKRLPRKCYYVLLVLYFTVIVF